MTLLAALTQQENYLIRLDWFTTTLISIIGILLTGALYWFVREMLSYRKDQKTNRDESNVNTTKMVDQMKLLGDTINALNATIITDEANFHNLQKNCYSIHETLGINFNQFESKQAYYEYVLNFHETRIVRTEQVLKLPVLTPPPIQKSK